MEHSTLDIPALVVQLKALIHNVPQDERLREELSDVTRNVSFALEAPIDSIRRISFSVIKFPRMHGVSEKC